MSMFDYIKVAPELNVPGSDSPTAVWQTQSGPCSMGMFKLSTEGCFYFNGHTLGMKESLPVFKLLNEDVHFYRLENGDLAEYKAKIRDGELVRVIRLDKSAVLWERK